MKTLGFNSLILRSLSKSLAYIVVLSANNMAFALIDTKSFDPSSIVAGGQSTLKISIANNDGADATSLEVSDELPDGVTFVSDTLELSDDCGALDGAVDASSLELTGGAVPDEGICTIEIKVTSSIPDVYTNTIAAGDINYIIGATGTTGGTGVDGNGAEATLTVLPPRPTVTKSFSPEDAKCGCTKLVITLTNPASTSASLTAPFVDRLPRDLIIVGFAETTCLAGSVDARDSKITLNTGAIIPANGFCIITANVESKCNGEFTNRIAAGALLTSNGSNALGAEATVNFCCEDENAIVARQECVAENSIDEEENISVHVE